MMFVPTLAHTNPTGPRMSRYVLTLKLERKQAAFKPQVKNVALEKRRHAALAFTVTPCLLASLSKQAGNLITFEVLTCKTTSGV